MSFHECPNCGMDCDCDLSECPIRTPNTTCQHECDQQPDDFDDWDAVDEQRQSRRDANPVTGATDQ